MGIKTYQEKNGGIFGWFFGFFSSLVCRIELILFPLRLYFSPDRFWYPYIGFTTTLFFGPIMVIFKFWGSMWRVKTVTKFKNSFSPILIYWNDNRIHLGIIKKLKFPIWFPPPLLEGKIQICFSYGFSRPVPVYKHWDCKSARPDPHVSTQKASLTKPELSVHWESRFFQTCHLSKTHGGQV